MAFCASLLLLSMIFSRFMNFCYISVLYSFLWLNNVLLYRCTACCLSNVHIWVVSTFWCYYEHLCTSFCMLICFQLSWKYIKEWNFSFIWQLCVELFEKCKTVFSNAQYYFIFSPAMYQSFSFFTSLPKFIIFNYNLLSRCDIACHCAFDFYFLHGNNIQYLFMCLLAICRSDLEKCLFKSFAHFIAWLSIFSC